MIFTVEPRQSSKPSTGLRAFSFRRRKRNHETSEIWHHRRKHPDSVNVEPSVLQRRTVAPTSLPSKKQMASHLATAGPRAMKDVSLDEFGNMVDPMWDRPIVKLETYALPESISGKLC